MLKDDNDLVLANLVLYGNYLEKLTITCCFQGDTSTSMLTRKDGRRFQMFHECASYVPEAARWSRDCHTIYNTATITTDGVLCVCNHNTSFAILMVIEN